MNLDDRRLARTDWTIAGAIFAVALAVRLVFLFTSPDRDWPHSMLYEGDAPIWVEWAGALDRGEPFEFDLPMRSPAVAYALSWLSPGVINGPFVGYKVIWCLMGAATCALVYLCVKQTFRRRIAMLCAGLSTFSFALYVIATSLNNETPYLLVLMLIVLVTNALLRKPTMWAAAITGALHGVAMLVRAEHMMLLGMMAVYMMWRFGVVAELLRLARRWRRSAMGNQSVNMRPILAIALMIACSILVCLPWSIRGSLATQRFNTTVVEPPNFQTTPVWSSDAQDFIRSLPAFAQDGTVNTVSFLSQYQTPPLTQITAQDVKDILMRHFGYVHEPLPAWSFLSIKGGLDFALANHPGGAEGFTKAALLLPGEATVERIMLGHPRHLKLVNHGYGVGIGYIVEDFTGWIGRVRFKLIRFADGIVQGFTSMNLPMGWSGERRAVDMFIAKGDDRLQHRIINDLWRVAAIVLLAGGALWMVRNKTGAIWAIIIGYKLVVAVLFYGYARQSASILPAMFLLMAVALDWLLLKVHFHNLPRRIQTSLGASCLVLAIVVDVIGSFNRPLLDLHRPTFVMTPQWGENAFQSVDTIKIKPARAEP